MKIISFFDRHRRWNDKRIKLLQKVGVYGLYNLFLDAVANLYLSLYFKLTSLEHNIQKQNARVAKDLIISLTSFPGRIGYIWMTIESLFRQEVLPERIVLYLSKNQFPEMDEQLPHSLKRLKSRGLDIRFVDDDLRSHKKYYYAMNDFPDKTIITVDDDCLYPEDIIGVLWRTHLDHPNAIVGNRVKKIYSSIPRYEHWPAIEYKLESKDLLFIGCAGILYPPKSLYSDAFKVHLIKTLAYTADDIWLSCMARLNGMSMISTGYNYHHLRILIWGDKPLYATNSRGGNQDAVDNLNEYYLKTIGKRPFIDMVGDI